MSKLAVISIFYLAFTGLFSVAHAQVQTIIESPQADETSLTIYPKNIAMVREVRTVDLPEGRSTIRLLGVSDKIIAQTAILQSFEGIRLENNFNSDLISKGSLLNKSIGQTIQIQRVNSVTGDRRFETVKLRSAPQTGITVQGMVFETDNGIETLYCSGLAETILLNNLPDAVNAVPVLTMDVITDTPGEKEIALSYITKGIGWNADYIFDVDEDKGEGNLLGWLTIRNNTSKTFKDVPTAVIAGEINLDRATRPDEINALMFSPKCWEKGTTKSGTPVDLNVYRYDFSRGNGYWGDDEIIVTASKRQQTMADLAPLATANTEIASEEDFADFKLYRTARPVTVAAMQKKQVAFVNAPNVEFKIAHKFDLFPRDMGRRRAQPLTTKIFFEIDNSKDGPLNKALPAGIIRVMSRRENDQTYFRGEAEIDDLAVGLPVKLEIGQSPLVQVLPQIFYEQDEADQKLVLSTLVSNATNQTRDLELRFPIHGFRVDDIHNPSHPHKEGQTIPVFPMVLAPNSYSRFEAEFPISVWVNIQHGYQKYKRREPETTYEHKVDEVRLSLLDNPWQFNWVSQWVRKETKAVVVLNAEIVTKKELPGGKFEFEERFTFTNNSVSPLQVSFEFPPNDLSRILSSSMVPYRDEYTRWPRWIITLGPNETKTMTVKSQTSPRDY